jgi:hypothetical protein
MPVDWEEKEREWVRERERKFSSRILRLQFTAGQPEWCVFSYLCRTHGCAGKKCRPYHHAGCCLQLFVLCVISCSWIGGIGTRSGVLSEFCTLCAETLSTTCYLALDKNDLKCWIRWAREKTIPLLAKVQLCNISLPKGQKKTATNGQDSRQI